MDITWDYEEKHCDIAVLGYVLKQLQKFKHKTTKRKQHAPSKFIPPTYGQKIKIAKKEPEHNMLSDQDIKKLQRVIGAFLWYGRITDLTMLHALNSLASAQSKSATETKEAMEPFLNYYATHPDATVRFHASNMILKIHSDASYLSETQARNRVGGYYFMGNKDDSIKIMGQYI